MLFLSAIMDCVGCEKCRLWGKLQVLGLGTALKILFSVDGESHLNQPVCNLFFLYFCNILICVVDAVHFVGPCCSNTLFIFLVLLS
jgi:hypothetical protein